MKKNNLQKKPGSAEKYANLFLLDENSKKRDFSKANSVCFITIGYAETLWILLQELAGKDITIIDRKSEIDFIEALKKTHNRDDIKIIQKFEVETEDAVLNTILNLNMSFDLIIANPPYHNRLYKSIIEICCKYAKETCVLCPWEFVDHKVEKRFQDFIDQNLNALEKIDNSKREFFDIGKDYLGIVYLSEKRLNLKDFQTDRSYKSKITDLLIQYNENKNNFKVYVQPNRNPDKFKGKLNTANCFAKACRGGFHFGGKNFDYIFNTTKDPKIIFRGENGLKIGQDIILLDLENPDKKANLVKWIYNSKLALFLVEEGLKDSRSTLGSFHTLIPFVDWSRPWTDKEILKELGLPEDFLKEKE